MYNYTKIILLYMYTAKQISHSPVTIDTTRPASRATGSSFNAASNSPAERGLARPASYTHPCVYTSCFGVSVFAADPSRMDDDQVSDY